MTIRVVRPGQFTTVQDIGRRGHQHMGVPEGGAMDTYAARLANALVGNDDNAAVLEATLTGPLLVFDRDCTIALGGADFGARLDGERVLPWTAIRARAGATLDITAPRLDVPAPRLDVSAPRLDVPHTGCRAYLAIDGGIDVPVVLASRATCLVAGFGGGHGRPLKAGDVLPLGTSRTATVRALAPALAPWTLQGTLAPALPQSTLEGALAPALPQITLERALAPVVPRYRDTLRLIPGEHVESLGPGSRDALVSAEFRVSRRSDRMGYRLDGPALNAPPSPDLLSAAVTMGTLQLPAGGAPILLMADRQTTGGYPVLGQVATVDLGSAAQLRPGDTMRFEHISLEEAQRLYLERERAFDSLRHALAHSP